MQACTKTHHFEIKNEKIFSGGGHPFPRPTHLRRLDLRAYGAQAQRDTPRKKILVTVLHGGCHIEFRNINGLGEDFQQI